MAQAPIISPTPATTSLQWLTQRPSIAEASSGAFVQGQFVKTSGSGSGITLLKVADATSGESVYGLSERDALGGSAEPYKTPTATTHQVTSPVQTQFWVNVMTNTRAVGTGAATALVTGSTYDLRSFTTSGYTNIQGLDASSTGSSTTGFFKYEGKVHPDDAATDTNPRVLVSVVAPIQ